MTDTPCNVTPEADAVITETAVMLAPLKQKPNKDTWRNQFRLTPQALSREVSLKPLPLSTRTLKPLDDYLGQGRALSAINTSLSLPYDGYNVFAAGTSGLGKRTMIKRMLTDHAKAMPTPSDWAYVNNFEHQRAPIALEFPPSEAPKFKKMMHQAWSTVFNTLEKKFASTAYHAQIEAIRQRASHTQQDALKEITAEGIALSLKLVRKEDQHYFVAVEPTVVDDLQQFTEIDLTTLPNEEQRQIKHNIVMMEKKLTRLGDTLGRIEERTRDEVTRINEEIALEIVKPKLSAIALRFEHINGLDVFIEKYINDVVKHVDLILAQEDEDFLPSLFDRLPPRYQVNVVVSNKPNSGAPIIYEDLPTYFSLLGTIEQHTHMGTITTDFTMIRGGALHRANGGFLLIEAEQLVDQPYAWHGLKRALRAKKIQLSSLEHMLTLTGNITLDPDAIPIQLKVVLLGEPDLYYEMLSLDPEFNALFKIRADFADTLPRTADNEAGYIHLIADFANKKKLQPVDRSALVSLLTDSSRIAEDQELLTLHTATLGDLLLEANVHAVADKSKRITAQHIEQTLADRRYRLGYLRDLYWQDLARGTQLIQTAGHAIGQINALTVVHYADSEFGMPSRLTASVYQGGGEILDIERTVELGGALHAKGILIMGSYLRAHFGRTQPLHFSAALAFEQNYGEIDGDSATLAELCALISSISELPIDQSWAITGSMNQRGEVQPIGGINAKIEGFFDTCLLTGLTGDQGVIIPIQNKEHLMLRADVIEAVKSNQFHICAVRTVEEAMSILMSLPAGTMNQKGCYPKQTIYGQVMRQLKHWQQLEDGEVKPKKKSNKKKKEKKSSVVS